MRTLKPTEIKICKKHGSTDHFIDSENNYRCRACSREASANYLANNKEKKYAAQKERRDKARRIVLQYYSGNENPFCICCGETIYEFLSLDHIEGNGNKHRDEVGLGGARMYQWAIKNNYPSIFRVLCHNCNLSYGLYGYCPHQQHHHTTLETLTAKVSTSESEDK